jgi:hypothetical protein
VIALRMMIDLPFLLRLRQVLFEPAYNVQHLIHLRLRQDSENNLKAEPLVIRVSLPQNS